MPLGKLTPPPTLCQSPPGFSATSEALGPPSLSPTLEESPAVFSCRLATLSLSVFFALWCPPLQLQPIPFRLRLEWCLHRPLCLLVFLRAASL